MNGRPTYFEPGDATAYVSPRLLVLAAPVDQSSSEQVARLVDRDADIRALLDATATADDVAVVRFDGSSVSVAARGAVHVDIGGDGPSQIRGAQHADPEVHHIEDAHEIRLVATRSTPSPGTGRGFRRCSVTAGVVPATSVWRGMADTEAVGTPPGAPIEQVDDAFDAMFGCTVARSVEAAAVRDGSTPPSSATVAHPPLAVLLFATGERVVVDRPILLGRNPHADAAADAPRLVKLPGAGVSRRHAAITVDRWRAQIDDLGSANGTEITLPGSPTQRLAPGCPVSLVSGARVDLGGEVSFVVEEVA